jgi:membrane-associated phospholipid phosphatase
MYLIKTIRIKKTYLRSVKNFRHIAVFFFLSYFSMHAQTVDSCRVDTGLSEKPKAGFPGAHAIPAIVLPASLVAYGLISIENPALRQLDHYTSNSINKNNLLRHSHLDDYLQYSPAMTAFGMKFVGLKSRHNLVDMSIVYILSSALEGGIVHSLKKLTGRMRPDGSANNSFPSGHTATAFVAAEFLYQEYKEQSLGVCIGGYTMASLIGIARILKSRHWVSDVVAGAGIGIISTRIVYWVYPYLQELCGTKDFAVFVHPSYSNETFSLNFSCKF